MRKGVPLAIIKKEIGDRDSDPEFDVVGCYGGSHIIEGLTPAIRIRLQS